MQILRKLPLRMSKFCCGANPQPNRWRHRFFPLFLIAALLWSIWPADGALVAFAQGGPYIDPGAAGAVAGDMTTPDGALHLRTTSAAAGLAGQDYADILAAAWARYSRAHDFRRHELQHFDPSACAANPDDPAVCARIVTGADESYLDVDAGRLYWRFCADYDEAYVGVQALPHDEDDPDNLLQIDVAGRCPRWSDLSAEQQARRVGGGDLNPDADPQLARDVRNDLLTAMQYFSVLAAAQPADLTVDHFTGDPALLQPGPDGESELIRVLGVAGLRATVNEIATVHMIFGHDFFARALTFPAHSAADAVEQLTAQQILLTRAQRQYELAATMLILTANRQMGLTAAPTAAELLGPTEYRMLDDALSALAETETELAARTRLLELGTEATTQTDAILFAGQRTGLPLLAALQTRTQPTQAITTSLSAHNIAGLIDAQRDLHAELTPLGYPAKYAAQESFLTLIDTLCGDQMACDGGMLAAATTAFEVVAADPHAYDRTLTALTTEMDGLVAELNNELTILCGVSSTGAWGAPDGCGPHGEDGGLLTATYADLERAAERVALTRGAIAALPDQLLLAQEQAGRVIPITIGSHRETEAYLQAVAAANAYKITDSVISPAQGIGAMTGTGAEHAALATLAIGRIKPAAVSTALNHALAQHPATLTPVTYIWAPAMGAPADFATDGEWQTALLSAQMADDAASHFVRKLLQRQAMLLIEERLALDSYNALAQQWNRQLRRYARTTAQLARAQGAERTMLLAQPYFRAVRSRVQTNAARQFEQAKRMAYLAATVYARDAMQPFVGLNELERAQNPTQLRAAVETLISAHQALPATPRTRQTIRLSLAEDIAGLPPALLDPYGALDATEMALLRDSYWQTMLAAWDVGSGKLIIPVTITPFDLPLPENALDVRIADTDESGCTGDCRGLWINLHTALPDDSDIDEVAVALARRGHSATRVASPNGLSTDVQPATLLNYPRPATLPEALTEVTGVATINADEPQQPEPELLLDTFNGLSPATANWQLEIDLDRAGIDLSALRDIELYMDVSYVMASAASVETPLMVGARSSDGSDLANGSVYKGVMVADLPYPLPGYDMEMTFAIGPSNAVTGTLCAHCAPELGQTIPLIGTFDPEASTLRLVSQPVSQSIHARATTQSVDFEGALSSAGVISGSFASTLTGYIAAPLSLSGRLIAVQFTGSDLAAAKTLNQPPVTVDDHFVVAPASVDSLLDPVANDADPDGAPGAQPNGTQLRLAFVTQPAHGQLHVVDNQVAYTPQPEFIGEDAFHYVVIDGRLFAVGAVTVEVTTDETHIYLPLVNSR